MGRFSSYAKTGCRNMYPKMSITHGLRAAFQTDLKFDHSRLPFQDERSLPNQSYPRGSDRAGCPRPGPWTPRNLWFLIMATIVAEYPQKNLWELDPPLHNLRPDSPSGKYDTQAFRDAAREVSRRAGLNPLHNSLGPNPFQFYNPRIMDTDLLVSEYREPPPLNKSGLGDGIVFS